MEVNDHLIDHRSNFSYFRAYLNQNGISAQEVKLLLKKSVCNKDTTSCKRFFVRERNFRTNTTHKIPKNYLENVQEHPKREHTPCVRYRTIPYNNNSYQRTCRDVPYCNTIRKLVSQTPRISAAALCNVWMYCSANRKLAENSINCFLTKNSVCL